MTMFHEEFRQKLTVFFSQKLREAKREKPGLLNSLFKVLGLHHCVQKDRTLKYRQILHALSGIPKEEPWHEFRIRILFNTRDASLDEWSRQMWVIYDIELFLRRHPNNETVRFLLVDLLSVRSNVETGIEVLDRIIEMSGNYLAEAYRHRAELLQKIDPDAAKQDFDKAAELMKEKKPPPSAWEFKIPDPLACDFEILPDLPGIPIDNVRKLAQTDDPEKMLEVIPDLRCSNLRLELYCAAASRYFDRNDHVRAKELLNTAVEMICREMQTKSEIGHGIAEIARTQGKLFGKEEGKQLLDLALKENSFARRKSAKEETVSKIINVQIELFLLDDAEKLIRLQTGDRPPYGLLKLADALTVSGNMAKANTLRQEVEGYCLKFDDSSIVSSLLVLARSYTFADEREKARHLLRRAMDLARNETYDFGLMIQMICDCYIDCGFLEEFKAEVSQFADREEIECELERIDKAIELRHHEP